MFDEDPCTDMDPSHQHLYHLRGLKGFNKLLHLHQRKQPDRKPHRPDSEQDPAELQGPAEGGAVSWAQNRGFTPKPAGAGLRPCHSHLLLLNEVNLSTHTRGQHRGLWLRTAGLSSNKAESGSTSSDKALRWPITYIQTHIPGRLPKIKPIKIQSFLYCVLSAALLSFTTAYRAAFHCTSEWKP